MFGGKALEKTNYWDLKRKKTKWPELLSKSQLPINIELEFLDEFIKKIEDPEYLKMDVLFPGTLQALEILAVAYECYLVSLRRNRENLMRQVEWLKIGPYFKDVLTGHSKNDGHDVKIALIRANLNDADGIVVGDTEADIIAGRELGLKTIALTSGIRSEHFLRALNPDYILSQVNEVTAVV
jgi:phosphoglycolate phosphatase